ncbi:ECF subfamily RNA polymerase sigma factor [Hyphomonas oceanitis SCH89]|uniref:ECF subfamily RNA polymerase sigma factor n=1 Tax=Hyphomonas oceanitis SCH89 TaxID=1280953 RepID=A0A059G137_9PROT|nr:ECF subfamily RNA polymerase sigma factor [Hyphomonas oceanitis SCH89]
MEQGILRKVAEYGKDTAAFENRTLDFCLPHGVRSIALTHLYHLHHPELLRFSRSRIGNAEDAEDLVQEAFISASRAYSDKPVEELRPLLFTILRNLTRDYLKSGYGRSRHMTAEISEMGDRLACHRTATPEQQVMDAQLLAIAQAAIDTLKPRQREALELHRLEGLTHDQIARRLAVSPRTVRSDIAEALAAIAKSLSQAGAPRPDKAE